MRSHALFLTALLSVAAFLAAVGAGLSPEMATPVQPWEPYHRAATEASGPLEIAGVVSPGRGQPASPGVAPHPLISERGTPPTGADAPVAAALVSVRGRVLWGGLPVVAREVALAPLARRAGSGDGHARCWDLTGEDGEYEVRLAPGRYGVLIDGEVIPGTVLELDESGQAEDGVAPAMRDPVKRDLVLLGRPPSE